MAPEASKPRDPLKRVQLILLLYSSQTLKNYDLRTPEYLIIIAMDGWGRVRVDSNPKTTCVTPHDTVRPPGPRRGPSMLSQSHPVSSSVSRRRVN